MTDDTEDLERIVIEAEDHIEIVEGQPRRGVGYPLFLFGLLVASALGAAGGGGAAYYLNASANNPVADLSPLKNDIAALETSLSKLENKPEAKPQAKVDMSSIEARMDALENAPAPDFPNIDPDLLTRLEAIQVEGSPALDLSAIEQRIDSLETAGMPDGLREEVQNLFERLAELEIQLDDFKTDVRTELSNQPETMPVVGTPPVVVRRAFPKAALLAAIDDQPASGGFFKRTMSKHIKVKDENSPSVIIEAIEADIAIGDMDAAKSKFDQLPSTIRSAGQDWRNSID